MAANNNPHFQRPGMSQCGQRLQGMMSFPVSSPGMHNPMMAGRPMPSPQFAQSQHPNQLRQLPAFLAGRLQMMQQCTPGPQNQMSMGYPVVSQQMGIISPRASFMSPNSIPWGSGSSSTNTMRVPGAFSNMQAPVAQSQGQMSAMQHQMIPQMSGQRGTEGHGNQGMTQALNQLVRESGNHQDWSRGRPAPGGESSSTALSSSDNECSSFSGSHMSDSDRDRSTSARRRSRERDRDRDRDRNRHHGDRSRGSSRDSRVPDRNEFAKPSQDSFAGSRDSHRHKKRSDTDRGHPRETTSRQSRSGSVHHRSERSHSSKRSRWSEEHGQDRDDRNRDTSSLDRDSRDRDIRDRDSRASRDSSSRDRAGRDRESRDRESRDRENRDRENRDRENHNRENRERENRDRENHNRENRERENRDRDSRNRGDRDRDSHDRYGNQSRDHNRSRYERSERSERPRERRLPQEDDTDVSSPSAACDVDKSPERPDPMAEDYTPAWVRCCPADLYFTRDATTGNLVASKRMIDLEDKFEKEVLNRRSDIVATRPEVELPPRPEPYMHTHHHHHHGHDHSDSESCSSSSSCSSDTDDDDDNNDDGNESTNVWLEELNRKKKHPYRLHEELWYNETGEMNDGPLCLCSLKSKKAGIRHNIFPGEQSLEKCEMESNQLNKLYHYHVTMSPSTNFLTKCLTVIDYDNHEYIFEGFSLFSHHKLENISSCRVIRFNIEYTIHFFEEQTPENFTVRSLDLFSDFLFTEVLELVDIDWKSARDPESCNIFHLMPRFARGLPENGKELLSMNEVLSYLMRSSKPLIEETELAQVLKFSNHEWQNLVDEVRGMIVTFPGKMPSSIRIDQLDRQQPDSDVINYPLIIHFGIRPAQLSYAGDPAYQKAWKQYVKYKHLLNSKPKVTAGDKLKLESKVQQLQDLRMKSTMKREVTVEISSEGFLRTGIRSDICQHALLLPVLFCHLRFHRCLDKLEHHLEYKFQDRSLLQLALTHTSYRVNYGTNPDHARNSLANCGMRQVEYGDRKIHYIHTRKRGINILIDIMSRMGQKEETSSLIPHNERLEFLGDAVVEFLSSVHLFYMFPWLEEGGLSTYRTAIVQNQHLAVLAKKLHLQDFMLYAHGPDLCHESDLRHAMANCFEALMGALFMDGGIELTDQIFARTLFEEEHLLTVWNDLPLHPLQEEEPNGDRHWVESSFVLQKLLTFEESIGVNFEHIRILAKAFTLRNVGYNLLTLGHNQRLEFLGDTVLQLVASEYLFRHFPEHHEGHLSLLRSSLVNNRTQSIVCDDLGMQNFVIYDKQGREKIEMKTKEKADLLEALLGAVFVDKDLTYCQVFCNVCFFPRLELFIMNQDWNDPKSQLQQCCLTLRELDGGEPDIPVYKTIESRGPTNTREYVVAVYFRGERLATGLGHSIQRAEMKAATAALQNRADLFPILAHQKRYLNARHKRHGTSSPRDRPRK